MIVIIINLCIKFKELYKENLEDKGWLGNGTSKFKKIDKNLSSIIGCGVFFFHFTVGRRI